MILSGSIVVDSSTVIHEGSVVVRDSQIEAVGDREEVIGQYPDHREEEYDILMPGLVGGHKIGRAHV